MNTDLLIPIIMITFGLIFKLKPPTKINFIYGYRTTRSMQSKQAWDYAHSRIGNLWLYIGIILFFLILISNYFVPIEKKYLSLIHICIGMIALIIGIPFVEKDLKEKFDEHGNLKK
jgi:uncharacterized membrane protein